VGVNHGFRAVYKVDGVIRRPAHGGTRRPPVERPGNGFGRSVRTGPPAHLRTTDACAQMRAWDPSELLVISLAETSSRDDAALAN
jgi:hypothetical protein